MRRLLIAVLASITPVLSSAQCTANNPPAPPDVILTDSNQHSTGGHSASTQLYDIANPTPPNPVSNNIKVTCNYTQPSSGSTCNTSCGVSFTSGFSSSERGTLNSSGTHEVFWGTATGQASSAGAGASCTGAFGGGTANCGPGGCQSSVGLTISLQGQGANASLSGLAGATSVWTQASAIPVTCAAQTTDSGSSGGGGDPCLGSGGGGFQPGSGTTPDPTCSPIIIDTEQEGFHLTSPSMGVSFDISGTGRPVQIAWTASGFHNAFLALPGADGLVHNGKELFGNFTPQPGSPNPNGFLALAEYDKPENGGNGDGIIDERDQVYPELRLWIDENHDGICQPDELHTLQELGIYSLALNYFESRRTDDFGNQFRYKARVNPDERRDPRDETKSGDPGRWAYDVFFVVK